MRAETFADVISFMDSFHGDQSHSQTRTVRMQRMQQLLDVLGKPQRQLQLVHVAGSKGKGSTASYIAAGISSNSIRCGLYLSPHISDYRERFTLAGSFFEDTAYVAAGQCLMDALEGFTFSPALGDILPTSFELYTCLAFLLFAQQHCQWAVIETGMGGRLDATNVIMPQACVLCPIELEHTKILGDTIAKIAVEKSKIIKEGVPVFVSYQQPEAAQVFREEARAMHSPIMFLQDQVTHIETATTAHGQTASIQWANGQSTNLTLQMTGEVQPANCALAIMVLRVLGMYHGATTDQALQQNTLPGRMQLLGTHPNVIIDGAHTQQSITQLLHSYRQIATGPTDTVIFGAVSGKDHQHMLQLLLQTFSHMVIARPGTFKSSDIESLYELARQIAPECDITLIPEAPDALAHAIATAGDCGTILTCGSFYLAGDVKKAYDALQECRCH